MKSKQPRPAPAADLYTSMLFRGRRAFVERTCDRWFVLSAKHGLLEPTEVVEPYDIALKNAPTAARRAWAARALDSIERVIGDVEDCVFEVHAGSAYRDHGLVSGLRSRGARVEVPAEGLSQGEQIAFYAGETGVPWGRAATTPLTTAEARHLVPFEYRWPAGSEHFEYGWEFEVESGGLRRVRHGVGRRHCFGRERVHTVTWVAGNPVVEGAEAEDYPTTRSLVSVLKRPDRKDARTRAEVPPGYERFEIVVHRDEIHGPNARGGLAVKLREDDLEGWAAYALLRLRDREARPTTSTDALWRPPPEPPLPPGPHPRVDPAAVADALVAYGRTLAGLGSGGFTPDQEADEFVQADAFAFLVAVICDEQVRFERAWEAPLELRRRLGHWDLGRIAEDAEGVRQAFREAPALHRWVGKTAARVSTAARVVLDRYGGDAALIWAEEPTAAELRRRFEAFNGVGQKKSAMAVELLQRGLGVPIALMAGSDVAVDVHVRRVFLRTGLADRDDVYHMRDVARALRPERPGELDNPAWDVGRQWCHASNPDCPNCPMSSVCPKLIDRAASVRGA